MFRLSDFLALRRTEFSEYSEMVTAEKLRQDLTAALKAEDKLRVSVLRLFLSNLHNEEIAKRRPLNPEDIVRVLEREIKQRLESIQEYQIGGRGELAELERRELAILREYEPKRMPDEEIEKEVLAAIKELGASQPRDLGRVMAALMPRLSGKAEGGVVNRIVREKLTGTNKSVNQ
jgi:uncharacterized protein YqeY